jgi:hypothetical protein
MHFILPSAGMEISARITVILSGLLTPFAIYVLMRQLLASRLTATLISVTVIFSGGASFSGLRLLSDLPYLLFSLIALVLFNLAVTRGSTWLWILSGVMIAVAIELRSVGIALLPALLIGSLFYARKLRNITFVLFGFCALFIPLTWYSHQFPLSPYSGYAEELRAGFSVFGKVFRENTFDLIVGVPQLVSPVPFGTRFYSEAVLNHIAGAALTAICVWPFILLGVRKQLTDHLRLYLPAITYCAVYIAIFMVWPWGFGSRFALPILLFLLYFFVTGIRAVSLQQFRTSANSSLALLIIAGGSLLLYCYLLPKKIEESKQAFVLRDRQRTALLYLNSITPVESVIAAPIPEAVFLTINRQAFPLVEDANARFLQLGRFERLTSWVYRSKNRSIFLFGPCPVQKAEYRDKYYQDVDIFGTQLKLLLAENKFVVTENYRSQDCQYWFGSLHLMEESATALNTNNH